MFRSELRAAVGVYDEALELSEDYDFWMRMTELTQVVKLPEALYLYRLHPGSVTHQHYGLQLLRKALGLDKALARRFSGRAVPAALASFAARDYLEAAVHLQAAGDNANLRLSLAGVLRHRPEWFETEKMSIPIPPTPAGEEFARSVFAEIPFPAQRRRRLARYLARLHMHAVFDGAARKDWAQVNAHLLPAVRHDPAWLLNRGVWAIAARGLAWRVRHGRWTGQPV
jgi:hypothetical protein